MPRAKAKGKKQPAQCPKCGAPQLTIWMSDGSTVAVDPTKIEVVFANQAQAGGHRMGAHTEHKCERG